MLDVTYEKETIPNSGWSDEERVTVKLHSCRGEGCLERVVPGRDCFGLMVCPMARPRELVTDVSTDHGHRLFTGGSGGFSVRWQSKFRCSGCPGVIWMLPCPGCGPGNERSTH